MSDEKIKLGSHEVLRVMPNGEFIWHEDADQMIEDGDFTSSPALPHMLRKLRAAEKQELVAHPVIAGALFDFMGWLTSRKERIVLSSADEASPAVDAIRDFAKMRGLSLNDAKVQDWNTTPPQRTWVGLTDEDISEIVRGTHNTGSFVRAIEAKLKEKNT